MLSLSSAACFATATKNTYAPLSQVPADIINTHNYQAMYYPDGSYAGINEIVFNFKPWLDWYLQTTGQSCGCLAAQLPAGWRSCSCCWCSCTALGVDATSSAGHNVQLPVSTCDQAQ